MFRQKPCPTCGGHHGHSARAVTDSSAFQPLRCKACGANFHASGAAAWTAGSVLIALALPVSGMAAWAAKVLPGVSTGFAVLVAIGVVLGVQSCLTRLYLNRFGNLVPGPRFG